MLQKIAVAVYQCARASRKERQKEKMQVTVEFADEEATRYDFRIKIKTSNQEAEQEIDYDQLREINRVLQPHNAEASALFPQFKMWSSMWLNQPQTEDLKKLEQV
jgi:hypothetical protein